MSYAQWNPTAYYITGDIVEDLGILYRAVVDNINSQPPSVNWIPFPVQSYASFSSTITQTISGANTPTIVSYTNTDINVGGFTLSTGNNIIVPRTGTYEIIPSIIFAKTGGGVSQIYFWFRSNNTILPNSSNQLAIAGNNNETIGTVAFQVTLNAGDGISIFYASSDATVQLLATPAQTAPPYNRPLTPSVITTIKYLGNL